MILHSYSPTAPYTAQTAADEINRQEITISFYNRHLTDANVWRYLPDQAEYGLDPWRITSDANYDFRPDRGERLFVQRQDLVAHGLCSGTPGSTTPPTVTATHDLLHGSSIALMSNGSAVIKGPGGFHKLSHDQMMRLKKIVTSDGPH